MFEKIVVVTRKTRLEELVERFNTRAQAKFYIEHSGGDFSDYEREDEIYRRALDKLRGSLNVGLKLHYIDRNFLPTYVFTPNDLIVAIGQDGLVANAAKYVGEQPILGINPDPSYYDGVLVPLTVPDCRRYVEKVLDQSAEIAAVTLAQAELNDGQRLLAFNDLFIGVRSHVSARYRLTFAGQSEQQSSSGIIVSTGAGSTGWLSSIFNMVTAINKYSGGSVAPAPKLGWDSTSLMFVVREPFASKHSSGGIVAGLVQKESQLIIESRIPDGGTIFSDGVESDFLNFNAGSIATISLAKRQAQLVMPPTQSHEKVIGRLSRRAAVAC